MRNRFLLGAGVAIAMACSWASAQAQLFAMPSGPGALYFGIEGGWADLADTPRDRCATLGNVSVTRKFDSGFNVGARGGYEWGPLRFEEEFNYAHNQASSARILGTNFGLSGGGHGGQINRYALMTNAIYDFTVGWPVTPHLGFGIGAVNLHDGITVGADTPGLANTVCAGGCTVAWSNSWEFGYQ